MAHKKKNHVFLQVLHCCKLLQHIDITYVMMSDYRPQEDLRRHHVF